LFQRKSVNLTTQTFRQNYERQKGRKKKKEKRKKKKIKVRSAGGLSQINAKKVLPSTSTYFLESEPQLIFHR
jgi:hypothetical protein